MLPTSTMLQLLPLLTLAQASPLCSVAGPQPDQADCTKFWKCTGR